MCHWHRGPASHGTTGTLHKSQHRMHSGYQYGFLCTLMPGPWFFTIQMHSELQPTSFAAMHAARFGSTERSMLPPCRRHLICSRSIVPSPRMGQCRRMGSCWWHARLGGMCTTSIVHGLQNFSSRLRCPGQGWLHRWMVGMHWLGLYLSLIHI